MENFVATLVIDSIDAGRRRSDSSNSKSSEEAADDPVGIVRTYLK